MVNPLTLLATAAGTPHFKPPEAFSDTKGDSCAADVWAIGMTLYLLLTDQLPFKLPSDLGWGTRNLFKQPLRPASDIEVGRFNKRPKFPFMVNDDLFLPDTALTTRSDLVPSGLSAFDGPLSSHLLTSVCTRSGTCERPFA
jgi:serine/threonine protein kinase